MRTWFAVGIALFYAPLIRLGAHTEGAIHECPTKVIEKAIRASGGTNNLKKLNNPYYARSVGFTMDGEKQVPLSQEVWYGAVYRFRICLKATIRGKQCVYIRVLNGFNGWLLDNEKKTRMNPAEVRKERRAAQIHRLLQLYPLLEEKQFRCEKLPNRSVQEGEVGIKVVVDKEDVKLFFDKKSGLLVRAVAAVVDDKGQAHIKEERYQEYKKIDGLMVNMVSSEFFDGKKCAERKLVEIRFSEKQNPQLFEEPQIP